MRPMTGSVVVTSMVVKHPCVQVAGVGVGVQAKPGPT